MTSTTAAEACCKTHLSGVRCNDIRQAEDPWRRNVEVIVHWNAAIADSASGVQRAVLTRKKGNGVGPRSKMISGHPDTGESSTDRRSARPELRRVPSGRASPVPAA